MGLKPNLVVACNRTNYLHMEIVIINPSAHSITMIQTDHPNLELPTNLGSSIAAQTAVATIVIQVT